MLFIHDHTFVSKNNQLYTTGSLNQRVMNRYKEWFGNVTVVATTREVSERDSAFVREENRVQNLDFQLIPKNNSVLHILKYCHFVKNNVKMTDCVVARMSILGAIGVYYAKKYQKPYLVEMVACPWDSLWYHSFKGKILAPFMTLLTKHICKHAPYVLYVTNDFLQKRYPTKGISVGCSDVELNKTDSRVLTKRKEKIEESFKNNKPLKLCTMANIAVKYKGQDIVIKSIKRLKKLGISCDYYLIGGGSPKRLERLISKYGVEKEVHIIGPIPHEEVFAFVDDMDLYVQPSKQEGLPRAVIEAMSRACPVIGARTGGIPELIGSDMVFNKGSEKDFINIIQLVTMKKLLKCAQENYKMSTNYEKKYLDAKRTSFYLRFVEAVKR